MSFFAVCPDCGISREVTRKANAGLKDCRVCASGKRTDLEIDESLKITFTCELDGCSKTRTIYKTVYDGGKRHYCSKECGLKGRNGSRYEVVLKIIPKPIIKSKKKLTFEERWSKIRW